MLSTEYPRGDPPLKRVTLSPILPSGPLSSWDSQNHSKYRSPGVAPYTPGLKEWDEEALHTSLGIYGRELKEQDETKTNALKARLRRSVTMSAIESTGKPMTEKEGAMGDLSERRGYLHRTATNGMNMYEKLDG